MASDIPLLLPLALGISLVVALLIYWIGGRISARSNSIAPGKTTPYACGEDLPVEESRIDLERFLVFAVYFLIFDVLAFVVATSSYATGLAPIAYSLVVLTAAAMLIFSRREL